MSIFDLMMAPMRARKPIVVVESNALPRPSVVFSIYIGGGRIVDLVTNATDAFAGGKWVERDGSKP